MRHAYLTIGTFIGIISIILILFYGQDTIARFGWGDGMYYVLLVLLGLCSAAFFSFSGMMESTASFAGQKYGTEFKFAGPIVIAILTVIGFYFLVPNKTTIDSTIYLYRINKNNTINDGSLILYIGNAPREASMDTYGAAHFPEIPAKFKGQKVPITLRSNNYQLSESNLTITISEEPSYIEVKVKDGSIVDDDKIHLLNSLVETIGINLGIVNERAKRVQNLSDFIETLSFDKSKQEHNIALLKYDLQNISKDSTEAFHKIDNEKIHQYEKHLKISDESISQFFTILNEFSLYEKLYSTRANELININEDMFDTSKKALKITKETIQYLSYATLLRGIGLFVDIDKDLLTEFKNILPKLTSINDYGKYNSILSKKEIKQEFDTIEFQLRDNLNEMNVLFGNTTSYINYNKLSVEKQDAMALKMIEDITQLIIKSHHFYEAMDSARTITEETRKELKSIWDGTKEGATTVGNERQTMHTVLSKEIIKQYEKEINPDVLPQKAMKVSDYSPLKLPANRFDTINLAIESLDTESKKFLKKIHDLDSGTNGTYVLTTLKDLDYTLGKMSNQTIRTELLGIEVLAPLKHTPYEKHIKNVEVIIQNIEELKLDQWWNKEEIHARMHQLTNNEMELQEDRKKEIENISSHINELELKIDTIKKQYLKNHTIKNTDDLEMAWSKSISLFSDGFPLQAIKELSTIKKLFGNTVPGTDESVLSAQLFIQNKQSLDPKSGVLVVALKDNQQNNSIHYGDIIYKIGEIKIQNINDFNSAIKSYQEMNNVKLSLLRLSDNALRPQNILSSKDIRDVVVICIGCNNS